MIGTEVIVEGGHRLDVFEGLDFSFNYSVSDIREPDKRQTEYTKTIKCPGTSNNNTLFGNLFEADIANPFDPNIDNIGVNFNPNKKAAVQVLENSLPVLDGSMQLRRISVTDGRIEYEVVFIGRLIDLFGVWGDRKMNEVELDVNGDPKYIIDLSDYDHLLTDTVQAASWSATVGDGYVYPLIDYGRNTIIDSNGRRTYPVIDLRPAMYVRTLWDKIFEFAGATYDGGILDNTQADGFDFDRLVIPWTAGFEMSEENVVDKTVKAINFSSPYAIWPIMSIGQNSLLLCDQAPINPFGQYNVANGETTINQSGTYVISGFYTVFSERVDVTGPFTNSVNTAGGIIVNGVTVEMMAPANFPLPIPLGGNNNNTNYYTSSEITLNAGDILEVTMFVEGSGTIGTDYDFTLVDAEFNLNPVLTDLFFGDPVYMNFGLPDISIKDFFLSILKMFNLYMLPDKSISNHYIFYTRDQFYSSGQLKDWTYKMDRGQAVTITPMGLLSGREYIYTYAEDGDYYNERYQNNYGRAYGTRRLDIDNDFVPAEKVSEVVFSATPLVNDGLTARIIPKIYDADITDGAKPTDVNVRILYYGGLIDGVIAWRHGLTGTYYNDYPYAGHWNNPITPTLDINFGLSFEYYYQSNGATGTVQMTNNNLFKAYHERQFLEIASKDSKLITAMFLLTPLDVHQLDFRDTILIDQTYYRLNKVLNYNPFKSGLTKVELFKAGDIAFKGAQSVAEGSGKPLGEGKFEEKAPTASRKTLLNGNQYEPFQGKVIGSNNVVSPNATGFFVQGDGNRVGASKNVTLIGSNCVVANGVENVTAIGVSGLTITESNTNYSEAGNALLLADTTPVGTTAVTIEETLLTYTGGRWEIGETRSVSVVLTTAANANTKTIRIKIGGATLYDSSTAMPTVTNPNGARIMIAWDMTRTSTTTATVKGHAAISEATTAYAVGVGEVTGISSSVIMPIVVTGQNGTANANDIVLEYTTIERKR